MPSRTLDLEKKLLGQWNALVRRARIGRDHKVAALTVSSYADADGTGIRLSVARYAVDLEVSYSTARRYLAWLRKVGLLEMTRAGSRRNGTASEYRLILGPHVLEELDVLTPARQKELADEIREANRSGVKDRAARAKATDQRSPQMSADDEAPEGSEGAVLRSPRRAQETVFCAQTEPLLRSPWMTHTPSRTHLPVIDQPSRTDAGVRTAVTVAREPAPAVVVEIRPGASQEAPYVPPPRRTTRAQDAIAAAMARRAAAVAAHRATQEAQ